MIDRELINYPEQFAAKLNNMDRDIEILKRGGSGGAHNNIQRTLVGYLWERIS